jgi:hypothetical protein
MRSNPQPTTHQRRPKGFLLANILLIALGAGYLRESYISTCNSSTGRDGCQSAGCQLPIATV